MCSFIDPLSSPSEQQFSQSSKHATAEWKWRNRNGWFVRKHTCCVPMGEHVRVFLGAHLFEPHTGRSERSTMMENNIRFRQIGRLDNLPDPVLDEVNIALDETKNNTGLTLVLALNYSSRAEITDAVRAIAEEVKSGELDPREPLRRGLDLRSGVLFEESCARGASPVRAVRFSSAAHPGTVVLRAVGAGPLRGEPLVGPKRGNRVSRGTHRRHAWLHVRAPHGGVTAAAHDTVRTGQATSVLERIGA